MSGKKTLFLFCFFMTAFTLDAQNPFESFGQVKKMEEESVFRKLQWISVGPSFQGGRVEVIDCPVDQPGIIYAGLGSGGLWKSTDEGLNWHCIFENEASGSIGALEVSVSDPEIIYLGTGENLRATQGYCYPGSGVYKSLNGGKDWQHLGLSDSHHIGRIVADPNDADLVFVAAIGHMWSGNQERGLFLSRDGGKTWQRKLFLSDQIGVVDVAWDPVNKILYAAAWAILNGNGSKLYRSEDLGETWQTCSNGLPSNPGIGRIGVAVSPSNPRTVYAVLDNRNILRQAAGEEMAGAEVYRSDDSGITWKRTHKMPLDIYSASGWAFGDIRVSPMDCQLIYVQGIQTVCSTDGGETFRCLEGTIRHLEPNRGVYLHPDHFDLFIDPENPGRIILGTAGGVYLSHNDGASWLHCNTIPAGEFHDIYVDDRTQIPWVYGGTKDNAGVMGPLAIHNAKANSNLWDYIWLDPWSAGDGFTAMPDPTDPQSVYYSSQNGYLNRKNLVTGETTFIQPVSEQTESPLRTSLLTPWFLSRYSPSTLYYGANKIFKSIDRGDNWYRLSYDLCYPEDALRKSRSLTALAESPFRQGLLFAGSEKGAVWVSRDDGINWIDISKGLPVQTVGCITPSCHEESRVIIAMKALDEDDYTPFLYLSANKGVTWTSISNGLPIERINAVLEDPYLENLVYVASDRGVYYSGDLGKTWGSIGSTLPTVSVQKLSWAMENQYLVAVTHGRSLFILYASPIRKYFKSISPDEPGLLAVKDGALPAQKDFPGDFDWERHAPAEVYWYQPVAGSMLVTLTDHTGKQVYSQRLAADPGINVWRWDLLLASVKDHGPYPITKNKFPAPGRYKVTIQGQGMVISSDLNIR